MYQREGHLTNHGMGQHAKQHERNITNQNSFTNKIKMHKINLIYKYKAKSLKRS